MPKVHKTLRFDEALAARVQASKSDGESDAAAYERIVVAGLDALEGKHPGGRDPTTGEHLADLREEIATLRSQLDVKDAQIEALQGIAAQAQALHGAADVLHAKQLESRESKRGGRLARAWAALTGKTQTAEEAGHE